jgi:hypothetical protein
MTIAKRELIWPPVENLDALLLRFWAKVDKTPGQGPQGHCWAWLGYKDPEGYGGVSLDREWMRVARVSYYLHTKKTLSTSLVIRHKCDWPPCVRPSHLLSGTQKDNVADKTSRGRCNYACGDDVSFAVLSSPQVLAIRSRYRRGSCDANYKTLAEEYKVHISTIVHIIKRNTWRHL